MKMNKDVKDEVKMYLANDWDIKEETPEFVVLKRNEATIAGQVLVFIIFGWWTLGIANLIYWLVSRRTKKIIK